MSRVLPAPGRSFFIGFNQFCWPISAGALSGSSTYRMSPKWASSYGTALDLTGLDVPMVGAYGLE